MYNPDSGFIKELKKLDSNLGCEYNMDTGRFNITFKRATGLAVPIIQVKTEDGGFRYPDRRELNVLGESDLARVSMRDRLNKSTKYMQDYREKKAKEAKDNLRNMTKDGKRQLYNAFSRASGASKGNSTFRRINQKPKGEVFK